MLREFKLTLLYTLIAASILVIFYSLSILDFANRLSLDAIPNHHKTPSRDKRHKKLDYILTYTQIKTAEEA